MKYLFSILVVVLVAVLVSVESGMHPVLAKCKDLPDGSLIRDDPDCTGYWICRHGKEGRPKIGRLHRCPPGHAFDKESNKCDWEENVDDMEGCNEINQLGTSPDILAQCKDLPDRSFIRDDPDCSAFWYCRHGRGGRPKIFHHRCPNGWSFDKESKRCDWDENVDMEGCNDE